MYAHAFVYSWVSRWFVVYLRWWYYHSKCIIFLHLWIPKAGQVSPTSHSTRMSPIDQLADYHALPILKCQCFWGLVQYGSTMFIHFPSIFIHVPTIFHQLSPIFHPCSIHFPSISIFGLDSTFSLWTTHPLDPQEVYGCSDPLFTQSFKGRYMPRAVLAGPGNRFQVSHDIPSGWWLEHDWILVNSFSRNSWEYFHHYESFQLMNIFWKEGQGWYTANRPRYPMVVGKCSHQFGAVA